MCTQCADDSKRLQTVELCNECESQSYGIPDIKAPAANRPEQAVYALGTGIVGLLLQTRQELHRLWCEHSALVVAFAAIMLKAYILR